MEQYPRMLYKPGKGDGEMIWGHRLDTSTVQNAAEYKAALRKGWHDEPNAAIKRLKWHQRVWVVRDFYLRNWQWLWGTLVAVVLAIKFGN